MKFFVYVPAFEEFFHIKQSRVVSALGVEVEKNGWAWLYPKTKESQEALVRGLQELLQEALPLEA